MQTTSLKLPESLKNRIASIATARGTNSHAFMLDAIERMTAAAERRTAFVDEALAAREDAMNSGTAYSAQDVHTYLKNRLRGEDVPRPKAVSWHK
ncbi:MAG: hypothetical protein Q8O37_16225 [Sulfuricellaceae bacterium]|nr:hypothetical protein [Sulfuricellaceae bacterium]